MPRRSIFPFPGIPAMVSIGISALLFSTVQTISTDHRTEAQGRLAGREYRYRMEQPEESVKGFSDTLWTLFRRKGVPPPPSPPPVVKKEQVQTVQPPPLVFVGMVKTGGKKRYSFKNTDTGSMLFLEKGITVQGLTLRKSTQTACILEKGGTLFKVGKR